VAASWWIGAETEDVVLRWAVIILDTWLALARVIRASLGGIGCLRNWWRSLPGDMLGRLVMVGCGIPAPTREHDAGEVRAVLVEDPRVARWFRVHAIPVEAQTLGRYVFSRGPLPPHTLAHEVEHIRQWERYGPLFLPLYFGSSAVALCRGRRPYWENRFEAAARMRADRESAFDREVPPDERKVRILPEGNEFCVQ
jgi:hypothetical protein